MHCRARVFRTSTPPHASERQPCTWTPNAAQSRLMSDNRASMASLCCASAMPERTTSSEPRQRLHGRAADPSDSLRAKRQHLLPRCIEPLDRSNRACRAPSSRAPAYSAARASQFAAAVSSAVERRNAVPMRGIPDNARLRVLNASPPASPTTCQFGDHRRTSWRPGRPPAKSATGVHVRCRTGPSDNAPAGRRLRPTIPTPPPPAINGKQQQQRQPRTGRSAGHARRVSSAAPPRAHVVQSGSRRRSSLQAEHRNRAPPLQRHFVRPSGPVDQPAKRPAREQICTRCAEADPPEIP